MTNKIKKEELKRKAQEVKDIVKGIVNETVDIPNNAIIIDVNVLIEIFTKKRMELIQFINQFKPQSVQELAELTGRKKQAVNRDLKMLERRNLLEIKKVGRTVIPTMNRKFLVMGMTDIYPLGEPAAIQTSSANEELNQSDELLAHVYVDGVNVNQQMCNLR